MDDDNNNNNLTIDTSPLTIPIIEQNEKLLSSMSSSTPIISSEIDEKVVINKEYEQNIETIEENNSHIINLDHDKIQSPLFQSHSPQTIISTILEAVITQIELNNNDNDNDNNQLNSLPIIEDDQLEVEEDDDDDDDENDENEEQEEQEEQEEEEEEEEIQETPEKNSSNKSIKIEKERSTTKSSLSPSSKHDLKPTTRTLRSHARKKISLSALNQTLSNPSNIRRVSNRRRALEKKIAANEKEKKRKSISERLKKDKDNMTPNDDNHTSSNSDDQINENPNIEKVSNTTTNQNDDASSCSSTGAGDGSSTSSSTINLKQSNINSDIDSLPPNKRRLRERNAGLTNTFLPSSTTDPSTNSDNSPIETITTREIPINSIKQFLEIRQQVSNIIYL